MKRFFSPRHIAVVGASTKNQWFSNLARYAQGIGFEGNLYPVNPHASEVCGVRAYPSISALPEGVIDFAVVMVKSALVLPTLGELKEAGIRDVLLITSGYAEVGSEGSKKQEELRQYCLEHDIMLMGPNCLGFMSMPDKVSTFTGGSVEGELMPGSVALIGQSGASSEIIATKLLKKSLGISLFAATGNEAVLTAEDCLEYLIEDPSTRVITGFIEGFRDIPRIRRIADAAVEKGIPLIFLKVGRSEKGVQAARSHTGAMAGNDAIVSGFFRQHGIIRVDTIEELAETASIFARCRLPKGNRLGICTFSGGLCGLYADLCSTYGIELPRLSEATKARLKPLLPEFAQPDNPLDITGSGFLGGLEAIVSALLDDENLDMVAPVSFSPAAGSTPLYKMFNDTFFPFARTSEKPVITLAFREVTDYGRKYYHEQGLYHIEHAEDSFKAIAHFMRYARFREAFLKERNP
ncbi:MAG TPA: CoA-binding protein [Deltaproteobacteria bacterium]|nr:CoA-binding protein [Deltaproteobacteria bacterium]HOI06974.1 CoA-binding protein [Deltaproteobacteria bacterium]